MLISVLEERMSSILPVETYNLKVLQNDLQPHLRTWLTVMGHEDKQAEALRTTAKYKFLPASTPAGSVSYAG